VITEAKQNKGNIEVTYTMAMGYDGADSVEVKMFDADGKEVASKTSADSSKPISFAPSASGSYTFSITAKRADCEDKTGNTTEAVTYVLPLAAPSIESATSVGSGSVNVVWGVVAEAESYEVYAGDTLAGTTATTEYTVTGLTVGNKYAFTVKAVRGDERSDASKAVETTVTADKQQVWGFTRYGSSTDDANNGYIGSANDGSVTVFSEGGKGKVVPASTDGIAFYYTAVPTEYNFTLRAKVHIDSWTFSNGQEGFGLIATDRLGENGVTSPVWNNQYMVAASKIEYLWNADSQSVDTIGTKYSMKCGLGVIAKTGVTKDNLAKLEANDTATVQNEFKSVTTTLDTTAGLKGLDAGTYNIVGNASKAVDGTIVEYTDFILEIQKNNTGYFITYYDADGNVISKQKNYDPDALSKIDSENVYVGFFASRNARATFSDIQFTTILASEDAPKEETPVTYVTPTVSITSAGVANTENYTFSMNANVDGTADITLNGAVVSTGLAVKAGENVNVPMTLTSTSKNDIAVVFTPDPNYVPGENMAIENTDKVNVNLTVTRNTSYSWLTNIYVSPNGSASGDGTRNNPVDIYTAVKYVQPGQTIVITEGTYLLDSTVRVERGVNGTSEKNIRMVADPNASTRPVFDFQGKCAGMVFGGDYWYFNGFDCTHSQNAQKGIQISGSHNVLDNVNAYHNGNTGIQISRLYSSDTREQWPSYNLILNCTSYGNADAGYEDADGFAAKLTVGDGNVFDGCVAYNNADDGWDLFAKVETGSIGSVTIQNCVAYGNGYLEDGTNAGNGNGFKMGGDSLSGYHKLINSYAFNNKAKGIDSNSCPDIQVTSSISYNNESYNVAFYTNNAANTDFAATGILSFKDSNVKNGLGTGEQHKPVGSQDKSKYLGDSNYYWDGSKSANASGAVADATWFKSLAFTGITRNADGTINLNGFLETTDVVPEGVGARPTGTPSRQVVLLADSEKPVELPSG
ncbi:MAG: right-handed parallel beta-helix repeat-containing protein, partial [Lachnospiraceae bacterium]